MSKFTYYDDLVQPGAKLVCVLGEVISPGNFYVVLQSEWNNLEHLMEEMQSVYDHMEQRPGDLDRMEKGQPLAVLRPLDRAWHRAVFLNHDSSGRDLFVVKLVDYGDIISVALKDIRPLRSDHVAALIGTGIRCTLCLGPSYNPLVTLNSDGTTRTDYFNEDEGWTLEDRSMLLDFIYNKDVLVDFQQRTVLSSGEVAWEVFIHHATPHIERELMIKTRGTYCKGEDEPEYQYPEDPFNISSHLDSFKNGELHHEGWL